MHITHSCFEIALTRKARIFASPSAAQLPLNLDLTDSDTDGLSSPHFAPAAPAGWIDCNYDDDDVYEVNAGSYSRLD